MTLNSHTLDLAVPALVSLLGVVLGWGLNVRSQKKQAEKAERDALLTEADEFASAAVAVRVHGRSNDRLWNGWLPTAKVAVWSAAVFLAGYAESPRSGFTAGASGLGHAARLIASRDGDRNWSAASLSPAINRVITAAMPLWRHSDEGVTNATEQVLKGVLTYSDERVMEELLSVFRQAIRTATEPPAPWFRRLLNRHPGRSNPHR